MRVSILKPSSLTKQTNRFSLFFGTFDAIVLIASIYILFPKEQPELVRTAMQHFQWAVERFEAMSERNALARAALGVLHAIHIRLKKSLNFSPSAAAGPTGAGAGASGAGASNTNSTLPPRSPLPPPTPAATSDNPSPDAPFGGGGSSASASVAGGHASSLGSAVTPTTASSSEFYPPGGGGGGGGEGNNGFDWSLPNDFDWSSIQPIFATGDLVYNDLVGIPDGDGQAVPTQWGGGLGGGGGGVGAQQPWQFEGDFGNDSVWNLLNQYTPL